jgi:putative transposase
MPRTKRSAFSGVVYHVLNRANARAEIFRQATDYEAFEWVLTEAVARVGGRLRSARRREVALKLS